MNINILRRTDKYLGNVFIRFLNIFRRHPLPEEFPKKPRKILVIKLFGFGNFIFLSPVFKELRALFPKSEIHVLTFNQNKAICNMYPAYIDKVHTIGFSVVGMFFDILKFANDNQGQFDVAIDFEQFVRLSAIIGQLLSPRFYVGTSTKESGKAVAFDYNIDYKEQKHVVEEFYAVITHLERDLLKRKNISKNIALVAPVFKASSKARKDVESIRHKSIIGICTGGRDDDMERRYPKEFFAEAVQKLARLDAALVFVGGKSEKAYNQEIIDSVAADTRDKCFNMSGSSLDDSAYIISLCKVFISNDTGPIHLAASLGIYCIGLYGPSKEWIYGPYTEKALVLRHSHKPVRSNHNEKNMSWNAKWWPPPEKVYNAARNIVKKS